MTKTRETEALAYIKYFGKSVDQGLLDSRKAADALIGFDQLLRFYMVKDEPLLKDLQYEFPVAIQKGSWEIVVPSNIDALINVVGKGVVLTAYLSALAKKSAGDGLFETGPVKDVKKIVAFAIKAIQWTINISKKMGRVGVPDPQKVRIVDSETVEITDDNGSIQAPIVFYELYLGTPSTLFSKAASVIESGRELEIGLYENKHKVVARVIKEEKVIFDISADDTNGIVLPELEHEQYVELEGEITRCTANTNTIGFYYKGHTLTCKPESGRISDFKSRIISPANEEIFRNVLIKGTVVRKSTEGEFKEKKPHIVFTEIIPLNKTKQPLLFSESTEEEKLD